MRAGAIAECLNVSARRLLGAGGPPALLPVCAPAAAATAATQWQEAPRDQSLGIHQHPWCHPPTPHLCCADQPRRAACSAALPAWPVLRLHRVSCEPLAAWQGCRRRSTNRVLSSPSQHAQAKRLSSDSGSSGWRRRAARGAREPSVPGGWADAHSGAASPIHAALSPGTRS